MTSKIKLRLITLEDEHELDKTVENHELLHNYKREWMIQEWMNKDTKSRILCREKLEKYAYDNYLPFLRNFDIHTLLKIMTDY